MTVPTKLLSLQDFSVLSSVGGLVFEDGQHAPGTAGDYDGDDTRSFVTNPYSLNDNQISVAIWVNVPAQLGNNWAIATRPAGGSAGFEINITTNDRIAFGAASDGINKISRVSVNNVGIAGAGWKRILCTADGVNDIITMQINGIEISYSSSTTKLLTGFLDGMPSNAISAQFSIGNGQFFSSPIDGLLDRADAWDVVLTIPEGLEEFNEEFASIGSGFNQPPTGSINSIIQRT